MNVQATFPTGLVLALIPTTSATMQTVPPLNSHLSCWRRTPTAPR